MADEETKPLASSVDVGWRDGKPRIIGDDAREFLIGKGSRVTESKISGRMPRPRSKHAPKPALTVNYGDVPRNQMDNINLEEVRVPASATCLLVATAHGCGVSVCVCVCLCVLVCVYAPGR
jgi:hypothetical protein